MSAELSRDAQALLDERAEWGIPTSADPAIVRELAAAGFIDLDEIDWTSNGRDVVYGYTAKGRAYLESEP